MNSLGKTAAADPPILQVRVMKKPAAATAKPSKQQLPGVDVDFKQRAAAAAQGVKELSQEAKPCAATAPVKPHAKSYTVHSPDGKGSIEAHLITRHFWCVRKGGQTITTERSFVWGRMSVELG